MGLDYRVACCPDGLMTDRRHDVKVLDCTIRDGGICNDWRFEPALVKRTYRALRRAGVDVMEVGYRTPRRPGPDHRSRTSSQACSSPCANAARARRVVASVDPPA